MMRVQAPAIGGCFARGWLFLENFYQSVETRRKYVDGIADDEGERQRRKPDFFREPVPRPRSGQTSWSRALVRHGAEAREALAGVLGVPAEDIRVRDRPE
jgi:hypothetical protein